MIIEQVLVTGMAVFCYIVGDESTHEALLIDPAGDFDRIFAPVEKHKLTVKYVINTHGHFDHTAGNSAVIQRTGATLLIHEKEAKQLKSLTTRFFTKTVMKGETSPAPAMLLRDGDVITVGGITLTVMHTPGHSEGSICLYTPGNVFTGDTLFTDGMGRTDLPGGSYKEIMNSITKKILTLPDDTIVWPGHDYGSHPKSTVREQKRFYR